MLGGFWLTLEQDRGNYGNGLTNAEVELTGPLPRIAVGAMFILQRVSLEPGAFYTDRVNGPTVILVESGTLLFNSLTDGVDRSLQPGDTAKVSPMSIFAVRNDSDTVGRYLLAMVSPGRASGPNFNEGMAVSYLIRAPLTRDLGVATLRLRQMTITPGEVLDPWVTTGLTWITVLEGGLGLTLTGEQVPIPYEPGVERYEPAGVTVWLADDTAVITRNAGDTPLVITILALEPVTEAAPP
jgi:quercetin dioxygenase-like cupin family protein